MIHGESGGLLHIPGDGPCVSIYPLGSPVLITAIERAGTWGGRDNEPAKCAAPPPQSSKLRHLLNTPQELGQR